MDNFYNNDVKLVTFLRELADSVESNRIQSDQLKSIGEFYMSYKFNEQKNGSGDNDIEDIDTIKFLTLGWFIYTQILNKNQSDININTD